MMRKKVIAANWKMNKTLSESQMFMDDISGNIPELKNAEAIICAPFPFLPALVEKAKGLAVNIAAQNMHFEDNGAYTGEVSPVMLKDLGVTHVIIGHSERREHFNETDEIVNKKVQAAWKHGLTPIVCVGESLEQREANETKQHVASQVKSALNGLTDQQVEETMIAYEPIWAIGTGKSASSAEANEVCTYIREIVEEITSKEQADRIVIQYGGSVKPATVDELLQQSDIDGALVGGASLEADSFLQLVEAASK